MTANTAKPGWEQVFKDTGERSRGIWKRGKTYYVQCTTLDPQTGLRGVRKLPLPNAKTEAQARKAAEAIKIKAASGEIYRKSGSPFLAEFIGHYLSTCHRKSESTLKNEKIYLQKWLAWLGDLRLSTITTAQILAYRTDALKPDAKGKTISNHTVNVRVNALKSLLKLAKLEGKLEELPTDGIVQLPHRYRTKPLLEPDQLDDIISKAKTFCPRSGKMFSDYVKLCAYSGGREQEVLNLQWRHVDFNRRLLNFEDATKGDKSRAVNFNTKLEAHLLDMQSSRNVEIPWLFPSRRKTTQGGVEAKRNITTFKKTQEKIEKKTGLDFSDHSFRHYFASRAVMSGRDFMTIARWLGHSDGGILVGRVYGHLNDKHLIDEAEKFGNL